MSETTTELARVQRPAGELAMLNPKAIKARMDAVHELIDGAMKLGIDYGVIPGTERKNDRGEDISKPTLFKPGAEKIATMFQLDVQYDTNETIDAAGHMTAKTYCTVYGPDGNRLGGATAIRTTRESRYRWRQQQRLCPDCKQPAIIKGKEEYGGGWLCWKKKGGCGGKFADGCEAIERQEVGKVENPDIADCYNTIIRMAEKSAMIAAIRQVTAAGAVFDEEIPDRPETHAREDAGRADDGSDGEPEPTTARTAKPAAPQAAKPVEPPVIDRAAALKSTLALLDAVTGYDSLKAWTTAPPAPAGFLAVKDEHYAALRLAVAFKAAETIEAVPSLEGLKAWAASPPLWPGFMKKPDEATQTVLTALQDRKLAFLKDMIDNACDKAGLLETSRFAAFAQQTCSIADVDAMTAAEAERLLAAIEDDVKRNGDARKRPAAEPITV